MTKVEKAFRAGFNAGMEYMAALEMGGPALGEDAAYHAFMGVKHVHRPAGAMYRVDPSRDVYYSVCEGCHQHIRITGLALAMKLPDAWEEVKE